MSKHAPFAEVQASRPDYDAKDVFSMTKSPNPDWKPGQKQDAILENEGFTADSPFREVEPGKDLDNAAMYKMMTWGITPRPVAFVSTMDKQGRTNLAPISWFNHVAADPPSIMISIVKGNRPSGRKDTSDNILELKEFCVSLISEPFVEAANYAAIDAPEGQSEWPLTGLTQRESRHVKVPHVAESAFSMECQLMHHQPIQNDAGDTTQSVFIARVRKFHIKEHVIDPDDTDIKIMPEKFKVVARLGGWTYGRVTSGYEVPRPVWAREKDDLERRGLVKEE
ncbi:hypothetical protein HD553DRAFT_354235 [Filobasidium floriforme]|uniref:uncharacterized protein n=1 Tax=Filobasidium floriforme TaxID=5210 RepID=UPI001E8D0C4F|nr:uncharacterized protein HD553DRAFT_354235 [Filobasidium floriforme]KAH8090660.1 hypothetical protein HD553DRAFT_354235 [Filobasidium floriforme]